MNSVAPTSMPRVGCAASRIFGSCAISRASSAFCRLPPESVAVRASGPDVRISKRAICSTAKRRIAPRSRMPRRLKGGRIHPRQRHRSRRAASRRSCRSSGGPPARGRPSATACASARVRQRSRRRLRQCPRSGRRTPATSSASSRWPLPETPAMPTISPAWSVSETSRRAMPRGPRRGDAIEHEERRARARPRASRRDEIASAHQSRQLRLR